MSTRRASLGWLLVFTASFVLGGGLASARADLLFTDGDFDAQTIGQPVGTPWGPVGGGNTVTGDAQSPYGNVYPTNGKGAHFPASAGNPYIVRMFADRAIPASATGLFYFNVDFRNNSADAGDYSIVITRDASGAARSVAFYVTGDTLYAESSNATGPTHEAILRLQTNAWYNLHVTLDLGAKTYSGRVASQTDSAEISSRPFVTTGNAINCVYTDGGTSIIAGTAPDHDLDNWALSTTPLLPLNTGAFVKSTSPTGSAVSPNAVVTVELQDNATQVVTNSIQLFFNGNAVSPRITKPAGTNVTVVTYTPPGPLRPATYTVRCIFADTAKPPVVTTNDFSFAVPGPQVTSRSPVGPGIKPDAVVQVGITDVTTQVVTNSIQLFLNGQAVTPAITKPPETNLTTVTYSPAGGFLPGSSNTVRIVFGDTSSPPVLTTNEFSFVVIDPAAAAAIVNIDFNGDRNVPGPNSRPITFSGQGAAGGGTTFNGLAADSRLPDGTDDDNLTVGGTNLLDSVGQPTSLSFTVAPVGGDSTALRTGGNTNDPTLATALFSDYVFNNSAGNAAGESPFTLSGLGAAPYVDLYFYRSSGGVTIPGSAPSTFAGQGIFTSANTIFFSRVPVVDGAVSGTFGSGIAVINGLSIATLLPRPFVLSAAPTGGGIRANAVVTLQLEDYVTQVATNSIQLLINGGAVTPTINKPAGTNVTTVTYVPVAPWRQGSTNVVRLVFSDTAQPPVGQTNDFSFVVLDEARAALIVNVDFNGARNVPGPRGPGPTYVGPGPAGGGFVWNGVLADSQLADGTDDDNLTVGGTNLLNSLGDATAVTLTVSPVAGDDGDAPAGTDPTAAAALLGDYLFVGSAGQISGTADFTLSGLGTNTTANLYFFRSAGSVILTNQTAAAFSSSGIFTSGNTACFKQVPVSGGAITGSFNGTPGIFYGMVIDLNPPPPAAPGPLAIGFSSSGVVLTWPGSATLQSANALTGSWSDVTGATSPTTNRLSASQQFFRLRQ